MTDHERLLTMAEAAALFGITVSTLRRWCRDGHIQFKRVNSRGDRGFTQGQIANAVRPKATGRPTNKKRLP
ncbi:MAG: helix-turn-helix domain-containing protein [bacterium]|nr:helix-turn-helix domain-containing protein [bacterium]